MKTRLKNDIIGVLEYFEHGLADIEEGSGEEQPKLKEIRSILRRMKANGDDTAHEKCTLPVVNPRLLFDKGLKYAYSLAKESHVDEKGELTVSLDVITDVAKTYVKHVSHFLNEG